MPNGKENEMGERCSIYLIQNDAETILSIMKSERDPIFAMSILPYYAMFYHASREYMHLPLSFEETQTQIINIRHYIKTLSNGFGKSVKRVSATDKIQNESFRNQLKFHFLRRINAHYNLGVYFNDDKKIVGNTQMIADCLGFEDLFEQKKGHRKKQFEIGKELRRFVESVSKAFEESATPSKIERLQQGVKTPFFYDLNTDRPKSFFNSSNEKETNLFFLYLLCNMNFVSEILKPLVAVENTWVFRLRYIVNYYTVRALERYGNYCANNNLNNSLGCDLEEILSFSENLFESSFRNCMMHYGITDEIKKEFISLDEPFCGLVESCFNGINFHLFYEKQDALSKMLIKCLENQFSVDSIVLKKL